MPRQVFAFALAASLSMSAESMAQDRLAAERARMVDEIAAIARQTGSETGRAVFS